MKIGLGFDAHRLAPDRRLVLGGVLIDYEFGLVGHSDADVLVHAVADAVLGAAGLEDIGRHFPDSDPSYKDVSSLEILKETVRMVAEWGYTVVNVDAVVIAESPRLDPYRDQMRKNLAEALEVETGEVSVKATTTEGLGFTGRGEGIAAQAAVLLERKAK
jgi:2-C-methyl-D-erythritol 2,4-cyclodiphosphate synthase